MSSYTIEHDGITYADFDTVVTENEHAEAIPELLVKPRFAFKTTTIKDVRWRSDRGRTAPHDVQVRGEYVVRSVS